MREDHATEATAEELDRVKMWFGDWEGLLKFMASIWIEDYGIVRPPVPDAPKQLWQFVTGGWSGNEEIWSAFCQNPVAYSVLWESSHRGGLHILQQPEED